MSNQKTAAIVAGAATNILIFMALMPISAILPTVAAHFHVDAAAATWIQTSYLLTLTSCLLISGRLGDLYGHRDAFLVGAALFTILGTASAFVQDITVLIVLRSVQGMGAALMSGNALAIITNAFKPEERGVPIGVVGMSSSTGALVGVGLSAMLAQYLNWQWLFFLNFPIGLIAIVAALKLKLNLRPAARPKVDYLGAVLLAVTLTLFSLSLSHLHEGDTGSAAGLEYHGGLLVAAAVALLLFVAVEKRVSRPMVELRYLLNAPFSFSVIANEVLHMVMMGSSFLLPFLLEKGMGLTPVHTAGVIMSTQAGNIVMAIVSGVIYDRTRWRFLGPVAMVSIFLGLGVLALLAPTMPYPALLVLAVGLGACIGLFNTPNNTIIMGTVPANLRGFAAGMIETSRQMGHMLGITASSAVMSAALVGANLDVTQGAPYIAGYQQAMLAAAGFAFLGIFAALVHPLARRPSAETSPELAKV